MSLVFLVGGILTLFITHLLKKVIFKGIARPVGAMGEDTLHLVEGVKMALWNSFPSGHTITAFTVFTVLSLYFAKCKSQYLWFSLAIIAGLSRVYLSQHFLIDVVVGSVIGVVIGFISMAFFCKSERTIHS
ncbi:phosphatase PAP2 family protein [Tenacibaculum sp. MAR_2009_124]|uniref:phosphatase PAP2 family protein n=1 Tax=Tenacibaculum sp. MAR_2009_124 TaxID=1250059 RepID=UPI00159FCC91|nr:phosphatase PAP2 family protein [Tenacibaculum sp. MAR_2009_124]